MAGCPVDLLNFRAASTVMQYRILMTGRRCWAKGHRVDLYEAAILNIQRACEAALDMGQHLIRRERLGVPQSARDVFTPLAQARWIAPDLADKLKRMVGFRNIARHDYASLQMPITIRIIETHLDDFLDYSQAVLLKDAAQAQP